MSDISMPIAAAASHADMGLSCRTGDSSGDSGVMSMRHRVSDDVDAEREGAFLGEGGEEGAVAHGFPFPAVAIVAIVRGDDHDAAFVVQDGAHVHFLGARAAARFPGDAKVR